MLGLTLASLRARPLRALLTAFSIVLGVAMISGTFVVTGQINRAFSEIFDAVNVKNDVVVYLRTVSDDNSGFQEPFPASVLDRIGKVPGVAAKTGEIDALGSLVTFEQSGTPKRVGSTSRSSAARVLDTTRALRPGDVRPRTPRDPRGRDRADRRHGQEGQRGRRLYGRPRHAGGSQAPARLRHLPDRHDGLARRSARQLHPARQRAALVRAGREVHAGQPAGRAGRVQDHIARPRRDRARPTLQGSDRIREGQGRLEGHRRRHQRLPRPRTAGLRWCGGAGRRLHHLQHVLDHGRAADPRDRDAAHARREPQAGADQRPARGTHDRPDRHGDRHLRRAPDRARHQCVVRRRRVRPAFDLAVTRHDGRRARARRRARRHARVRTDPCHPRDQDPADGRAARGRDAAAFALRALLPHPRCAVRAGRCRLDRQRRDRIRHRQPAPHRHGRRRDPDLLRGGHDSALRRARARAHRRSTAGLARERRTRARERDAQRGAHGAHGGGADDRRRPRRLRGGLRRGAANVVHGRARPVAQERSDRHADGSERRRHALTPDRPGARERSRSRHRVGADAGRPPSRRQARGRRQWAQRHPAGHARQGLQGDVGRRPGLGSHQPGRQRDPAREGRGDVAAREGRRPVRLLSNSRKRATVTVRGIYKDDTLIQNGMITTRLLRRLTDVTGVGLVLATVKSGSDPEQVAQGAEDRLATKFPTAKLQSNAQFKKSIGDQVNTLLALIYGLLGVSVLISLFGIVNTLLLSVHERTREIGMLRAIGMTRRQLRRTIRFESAITAVIGSLLGLVIGVVFGWIVTEGLSSRGTGVRDPVGHARRVPGRGGHRGRPGGRLAGLARLAHARPGRPQLRVTGVTRLTAWGAASRQTGNAPQGMPLVPAT